jgi:hypothetical protein
MPLAAGLNCGFKRPKGATNRETLANGSVSQLVDAIEAVTATASVLREQPVERLGELALHWGVLHSIVSVQWSMAAGVWASRIPGTEKISRAEAVSRHAEQLR